MESNSPDEKRFFRVFFSVIFTLILSICVFGLLFLSSCQYLPQAMDDVEKIADNDAIVIKCDKDCFQKETDLHINIDILNKAQGIKP